MKKRRISFAISDKTYRLLLALKDTGAYPPEASVPSVLMHERLNQLIESGAHLFREVTNMVGSYEKPAKGDSE